jgi:SAM-dependent methyltransferase
MKRVLEPELMEETSQAEAYAVADFAEPNQAFVSRFCELFPHVTRGEVVDLGCGTADIPIRLCLAWPGLRVTAVDGADAMLEHARVAIAGAGLSERISVRRATVPNALPPGSSFDAVISNSLLHHLPEPSVLWQEVRTLGKSGAAVYVVDLMRPASRARARALVDAYAADERDVLRRDFFNSLLAAFTVEEVQAQLAGVGLEGLRVEQLSDRHLGVSGRLPGGWPDQGAT